MKRKFLSRVLTVILAGSLAAQPMTAMAGDMDFISSEEVVVSEADTVATEEAFSDAPEPTDTEFAESEEDFTDSIVIEEEPVEESPEENSQDIFVENDLEAAADVFVDEEQELAENETELTEPIEFTDGIEAASEAEVEDGEAPAAGISSPSSATTVSFGTTYSGSLTSSVTSRLYKFTINSSGRVTLAATATISTMKYNLYDSSGESLWYEYCHTNSSGQSSISKYLDLTKGSYYLGLESGYSDSIIYPTGSYSFKLTFASAGESFVETGTGNNNTIAAAAQKTGISFGTTYKGQLALNDTKDFYKFTIGSSGRVTLSSTVAINRVYYGIYDSSGKCLWSSSAYYANSSGQISISEYFDLTKGTYYLGVGESYYTGNYSFKLTFASAGESFAESGSGNNNTIAAASQISLGTTYKGQLALNDDRDIYKFSISSSGKILLSAAATMRGVRYRLYDSDGSQLWYDYYTANNSGQNNISKSFNLTKGTYYLGVELGYTGNYSFKLTFTSAGETFAESQGWNNNTIAAAYRISLGTTYKGQLAINDCKDFYKFSIGSSGKYTLSSTSEVNRVYFRLYDSGGKQLWKGYYNTNNSGQCIISKNFDLTKGTYYLGVESSSYTGNYSFKITPHTHSLTSTVTKATTSRNGTIKRKCSCGYETKSTIYRPSKVYLSATKYTYDGKVKTPSVTVKASNGATISSSNYSVSYAGNRRNVGKYTVKVTFKGNYSGSLQTSFVINPRSTYITKLTSASKCFRAYWRRQSAQTSGYQVQFALNNRFTSGRKTYTISGNSRTTALYRKLLGNRRYYVRVRTYRVVSGVRYYSAWSSAKSVKTKR